MQNSNQPIEALTRSTGLTSIPTVPARAVRENPRDSDTSRDPAIGIGNAVLLSGALWVMAYLAFKLAGNEVRTRDLNLGKVALYQLSYSRGRAEIVAPDPANCQGNRRYLRARYRGRRRPCMARPP